METLMISRGTLPFAICIFLASTLNAYGSSNADEINVKTTAQNSPAIGVVRGNVYVNNTNKNCTFWLRKIFRENSRIISEVQALNAKVQALENQLKSNSTSDKDKARIKNEIAGANKELSEFEKACAASPICEDIKDANNSIFSIVLKGDNAKKQRTIKLGNMFGPKFSPQNFQPTGIIMVVFVNRVTGVGRLVVMAWNEKAELQADFSPLSSIINTYIDGVVSLKFTAKDDQGRVIVSSTFKDTSTFAYFDIVLDDSVEFAKQLPLQKNTTFEPILE
jgi:Skp family chaperone for outer membrane proteins